MGASPAPAVALLAFTLALTATVVPAHAAAAGDGGEPGPKENTPVLIPGGTYMMGTDTPAIPLDGEGPAVERTVAPFYLDRFETSNAEFAAFVEDTGYKTDAEVFGWSFVHEDLVSDEVKETITQAVAEVQWWLPVTGADWRHPEGPDTDVFDEADDRSDYPAVHVSHRDAVAFCKWKGGRLPTEAEWEFASRGGKKDRKFAWGNKLMPRGEHRANIWHGEFPHNNTADDGYWGACPVWEFGPQNKFGLYNMIGNVWEWVSDRWLVDRVHGDPLVGETDAATTTDFHGDTVSAIEVTKKGGSYMCHASYCYRYRNAARSHNTDDSTSSNLGVRCARDAGPAAAAGDREGAAEGSVPEL